MLNCRWCAGELQAAPLLELRGMPRAAQCLPHADELSKDEPVDLPIHRCTDCGLVQIAAEPVPYYRDVIRANAVSPAMHDFRVKQLADWVQRHGLAGQSVLEVGCGQGEFLALLKQAGVEPIGTEHGSSAAEHARAAGHTVMTSFPGDGPLPDHPGFAAWTCFNFMEHWPAPRSVLRHVRQRLQPGAVGLVEVPNFDMILSKGLLTEFIPDHIFYFTADTLSRCLSVAGFDVRQVRPVWHDYILSAEVTLRQEPEVQGFSHQLDRLCRELQRFAEVHMKSGLAIWGAGHQALSTLALSGIAPAVRYVVDSAVFKQGRYTPATHLPIWSPRQLRIEPVGAVIVMAAGYSDEVVSILKAQHDPAIHVAVVREHGLECL